MEFLKVFLVSMIAGLGAGVATGLAGLSAAAVISPMLISLLGFEAYEAVGISLASDVLASALSAYNYKKHGNIDLKSGIYMMISTMVFTLVGSYIASFLPQSTMGSASIYLTVLLGVKFIIKPVMGASKRNLERTNTQKIVLALVFGVFIGLICGIMGAGGGMMMLMVLVSVLGYDLKVAVGTSVFIMAFTALTGAVSHIAIGGFPDWKAFVLCVVFTLLGAQIASKFANKAPPKTLNRVTGVVLVVLGVVMLAFKYFG